MDQIFQTLLSWQFIVFGLAIAAFMFVIRQVVEYAMTNWTVAAKESKLWKELLLPILPVVMGGLGGFIFKTYPYPDGLTTTGSRFLFGLVAGLLSGLFYRVVKAMFIQRIQTALPNATLDSSDITDEELANQVRQTINKQ